MLFYVKKALRNQIFLKKVQNELSLNYIIHNREGLKILLLKMFLS